MFDSTLLKNMINSLIAESKRNFAIDLSPLDYIYSDTINVILALNRRILDVSGRLSLMGPSPEVRQILERTGIQNILKIFDTETELVKSSEDIILQTTRYNIADLQTYQQAAPPPRPKSEFEDLRSEISTAMSPGVAPAETEPERGFRQPQPFAPPPPQQQFSMPPAFKEEEFEAAYKSFETEVPDTYGPPPQAARPQPPQFAEPFTPPPAQPPRRPAQPPRRPEQEFAPVQEPIPTARRRDEEYTPPRLEPLAPPPATRHMREEDVLAKPEGPKARPRPAAEEKPVRPYEDLSSDVDQGEPRKRSPMPIIITALVVVVLAAAGFFGYVTYLKNGEKEAPPPVVSKPVPPPAPVAPPQPAPAPAPAAAVPPPAPVAAEEPAEKPGKKPAASKASKKAQSKASAEASPAAAAGKITITSSPSGATIKADDNVIGTTPFTWKNPNVIGEVTIVVSKSGYKESAKTLEYTGGSKSESFKLEREEAPAVSRPAPSPAPASEAEPEAAPPPPPSPPPPKPAPAPAAAPAAGGEAATVFIASIPPVADVYMDGTLIGKTNITKLNVSAGAHSMRFVKGTQEVTKDMTFKAGDNPSQLVNLK